MAPPAQAGPDALALLASQPALGGNIRELRNVLERAVMRSDSQSIDAEQLARILREARRGARGPHPVMDHPAPDADNGPATCGPWLNGWPS